MRHSPLIEAAARLDFASRLAEVERASVQRLFEGAAEQQNEEKLDALATFASLAATSSGTPEELALIDDVAHAACDAYDLISRPSAEKRWIAELVSSLFITIGQIPKAATVSRAYRNARPAFRAIGLQEPALSIVAEYAQSALSALNSDNLRLVDAVGGEIRGAVGKIITGDEARFAFVLSELLLGIADLLTADRPNVSTAQIEARIDLVILMARDLEHARLHQLSRRIAIASKRLIDSSTNLLLLKPGMLPSAMRAAFVGAVAADPAFTLWPSQRRALQNGAITANDHIVSEPTSAGKTLIAELKIAKFLAANPTGLAVYIAPYNALAAQVARNMSDRFRAANLEDAQLWTGTYEINFKTLATTNILVTTPEKLDAIIRASKQDDDFAQALTSRIGLFVLDEFHLIGGANSRAITYELLITRLKAAFLDAQFLAMSAVADNAEDIGRWLSGRANSATIDKWTPTRRRILIYKRDGTLVDRNGGVVHELTRWNTQKQAATKLALALQTAKAAPTLVMCTERRYAEEIAESIYEQIDDSGGSREQQVANLQLVGLLGEDASLPRMVLKGIAFHHAGLSQAVRDIIERMAREKELRCICSTTTLAEGVHLPFRSLVIPYLSFPGGEYMDRAMFQNIVGRAGRAYSNVRATVIVCDPGPTSPVSRHLRDEILKKYGEAIDVTSRLSRVTIKPTSFSQFEDQLRLESQVIGFIGDQTMLADQVSSFAEATFAAHQAKSSSKVKTALEDVLGRLETREPPIVQRNSPFSLTPFGKAASLSGISEKSVRVLRREIERMHDDNRPWFHIEPFLRHPLSGELRDDVAALICCPFEFISNSAVAKAQFPHLLKFAKRWSDARDTGWLEETAIDRFLLSRWLGGVKLNEIASEAIGLEYKRYPFNKKDDADRLSDIREYFDHNLIIFLWMLSAGIYLSENFCLEHNLPTPPHRSVLPLLEAGVPSRTALLLASEGLPRHLATMFSKTLPDTWETGEEGLIVELAQRLVRDTFESLEDTADKAAALEFCETLVRS